MSTTGVLATLGLAVAIGLAIAVGAVRQMAGLLIRLPGKDAKAQPATAFKPEQITVSKAWPLTCIVLGVMTAMIALSWASLVFAYDDMITPKGQVMMSFTTIGVMLFFIGILAYWRRHDRERKLRADAASAITWAKAEENRRVHQEHLVEVTEDTAKRVEALESAMLELARALRPQQNPSRRKRQRQPQQRRPEEKPVTASFTEYLAARDDLRREQGGND